jgi:L-fuculose-phosphate aldolase
MEFLEEYIELCKIFGGLTDLIQGPGGNFSIKNNESLIIKKSGALISNINRDSNWLLCDISKIKECINNDDDDATKTIITGDGKPSIEVFFHCIPSKIVLHFHPIYMIPLLCTKEIYNYTKLENYSCKIIEYIKPGVKLAKEICNNEIYDIYFLKNHGLIIHGNTKEELINKLNIIKNNVFILNYKMSDINIVNDIFCIVKKLTDKNYVIKPYFDKIKYIDEFKPFTPDIVVFLQKKPLNIISDNIDNEIELYFSNEGTIPSIIIFKDMYYIIGINSEICTSINEIFKMYCDLLEYSNNMNYLSNDDVNELNNWDKEKARKNAI